MAAFLFLVGLAFIVLAMVVHFLPSSIKALLPASSEDVALPQQYLWSVLLAVLAFNVFAYESDTFALGVGAFVALIIVALASALPRRKRTFIVYASSGIGVFAGLAFAFRANEFVQAVNVVVVMLSVGVLLFRHAVDTIEWNALWFLRTACLYPAMALRRLPGAVRLLRPSKLPGMSTLLRVVIITIGLVVFFAGILSSADPIFAEKISVLREQVVPRTILSLLLACAFLLVLAAAYGKNYTYKPLPLRFLSWIETAIPVGAVCVLFGVFLWVQATYLFADHESFKDLDLTYAEYVRKGMIEVLVATACAGVLSYVVSLKERELAGARERCILYAVNAVLLAELFLMLGSALKRDWMYMDVYGLTRVRVVGEIFLAWLAVIILLVAVFALWRRLNEKAVFAGAIAASFAVVLYLNGTNMDARIVSAEQPAKQKLDVYYMSMLSIDAVLGWEGMVTSMASEFEAIRTKNSLDAGERTRLAMMALAVQQLHDERSLVMSSEAGKKWRGWRWSDDFAQKTMSGSVAFSQTLDCLHEEIADYRTIHRLELAEETSMLLNDYVRPFVRNDPYSYDDFPYMAARTNATADSCIYQ